MTQQHTEQTRHFTFNTDGRPHPLVNGLLAVTLVLGVVSVTTAGFHHLHVTTAATGLAGTLAGGWGQYISATTAERFALVIGLGMAALGFYLGMAHGGFG